MRRAVPAALIVAAAAVPASAHAHRVAVTAPARSDVTLAQIRYTVARGPRPALRLSMAGPAATDYVAAALIRRQPRHALIALVAVVNRTAFAPAAPQVLLRTRPTRALAPPVTSVATNVLRTTPAARAPACALGPLSIPDLRLALHGGAPSRSHRACVHYRRD